MRAFQCWVAVALCGWALARAQDVDLPGDNSPALSTPHHGDFLPTGVPEGNDTAPMALLLADPKQPRQLHRLKNNSLPAECSNASVCFAKCCPLGQAYNARTCEPVGVAFDPWITDVSGVNPNGWNLSDWALDSYYVVIGNPCEEWLAVNYTDIEVYSDGRLVFYYNNETAKHVILRPRQFCLDYSERDTEAIICITPGAEIQAGSANWLYTSGMLVSVSGLVLTLLVYLAVDALRDLHGKSLICHVGCLAIAYCLLTSVQLSGDTAFSSDVCRRMAFAIQFFLLSSFLWLHVMCLDAFWGVLEATNSSPVPYPRAKKWEYDQMKKQWVTGLRMDDIDEEKQEQRKLRDKRVERKVFAGYSFYVWTLSLLPVLVLLSRGLSPTVPATYVDRNMQLHCQFMDHKDNEAYLYFYPFTALVMVFNIIIFICILIKAVPFNWNPTGPQRVPKQKARMCFLLFVLMSSNWTMDLVSWFLEGQKLVWIMLHAFYILQGLITFLIFVLEDRVKDRIAHKLWPRIRRINKKYGCCHRANRVEEATELRATSTPLNTQPGWVRCNK